MSLSFKQFIAYTKYVLKHKYYVFVYGRKIDLSLWRILTHDMSKFSLKEFIPYAKTFYDENGKNQYKETLAFNIAWLHHQKKNKHHHQYWVLQCDDGNVHALPMPETYVKEMIADWASAGKVIAGKDNAKEWYVNNKDKMNLNIGITILIEKYLNMLKKE